MIDNTAIRSSRTGDIAKRKETGFRAKWRITKKNWLPTNRPAVLHDVRTAARVVRARKTQDESSLQLEDTGSHR